MNFESIGFAGVKDIITIYPRAGTRRYYTRVNPNGEATAWPS
jgi:hypothetical protein